MSVQQSLVLIVDDEPRYLRLLRFNLESSGYRVVAAASGEEALRAATTHTPDLVLLDLRLPDMDGHEVCSRIREFSQVPVIMVTAKGELADKVRGLKVGADDYITKPFSAPELLARVEAVLRRSRLPAEVRVPPRLVIGKLAIDFAQRIVTLDGREVALSLMEYKLLHCLASNAGRTMTPEEIQEKVWGPEYREHYEGLRTHIHRLRQKIERDPESPKYVITRHGVGYMLAVPPSAPDRIETGDRQ